MNLGDPRSASDVPTGGVVHVESRTVLQSANHGDDELLMYAYGAPPETGGRVLRFGRLASPRNHPGPRR